MINRAKSCWVSASKQVNDAKSWTSSDSQRKNSFDLIWFCPAGFFANYSQKSFQCGGTRSSLRHCRRSSLMTHDTLASKNDRFSPSLGNLRDKEIRQNRDCDATSSSRWARSKIKSIFILFLSFQWNDMHEISQSKPEEFVAHYAINRERADRITWIWIEILFMHFQSVSRVANELVFALSLLSLPEKNK